MRSLLVATLLCLAVPCAADSLGDSVRAGANGQPVYVTAGKQGVVAHSADGAFKQTLVKGAVKAAILDPVWEIVWYVADRKLWVLDLREGAAAKPVAIVAQYPEKHGFEVQFEEGDAYYTGDGDVILTAYGDTPNVYLDEDAGDGKLKLVGEEWLRKNTARKDRASAAGNQLEATALAERVPLALCSSEDDSQCGMVVPFGKTGLHTVWVPGRCAGADDCSARCALYDRASKKFAELDKPTAWQGKLGKQPRQKCAVEFAPGNAMWIAGKSVCTKSGCRDEGDKVLGWLDRGDSFTAVEGVEP